VTAFVGGLEENTASENLFRTCRNCNVRSALALKRAGIGRRTHQFNPAAAGARSLGQWLTAVTCMKGESTAMSVPDAVAMIRATPPARRSEFARQIWALRREHGTDRPDEVPF
jgi:hypothetical protein